MRSRKHSFFILSNAIFGLITCFGYLYVWFTYAFMESMLSLQPLMTLVFALVVFFFWNKWLLRKERKKYWLQAVFSYAATIVVFIYFLTK
ncbi:hypothetical protein [Thalassobacillus devorans]|uniref:hypothetical protein n=1 Tax=Thalassobacillus devorans TaxID=279813 RepID=UPI001F3E0084|nr:hypothetical protein [Thalassobacillus devorans]